MDFGILSVLVFSGVLAALFAGIPVGLAKWGFFDWVGKSKWGKKVAEMFGSKEPSVFALNMCRVLFFFLIGYFIVSGIATDATNFEIHKPVIAEMEACNNTIQAVQTSFGSWIVHCLENPSSLNLILNGTLGV